MAPSKSRCQAARCTGVIIFARLLLTPSCAGYAIHGRGVTLQRARPGALRLSVSPRAWTLPARAAQPLLTLQLTRALLGDKRRGPLKTAIKTRLQNQVPLAIPDQLIDEALDRALETVENIAPGGLQRALTEPGALQKQREKLRRELSQGFAAAVDTGLGDQLEEQVGALLIDAVIDLVVSEADFLKPATERLADLEEKLADVKAEMGLLRLACYRLVGTAPESATVAPAWCAARAPPSPTPPAAHPGAASHGRAGSALAGGGLLASASVGTQCEAQQPPRTGARGRGQQGAGGCCGVVRNTGGELGGTTGRQRQGGSNCRGPSSACNDGVIA